jgi:hypothetical protein
VTVTQDTDWTTYTFASYTPGGSITGTVASGALKVKTSGSSAPTEVIIENVLTTFNPSDALSMNFTINWTDKILNGSITLGPNNLPLSSMYPFVFN